MLVLMLPSPLLGHRAWLPTAEVIDQSGWTAAVCHLPPLLHDSTEVVESMLAAVRPEDEVVLVTHSNAGLFVPQLVARRNVVGSVFVDAALPPPAGSSWLAPQPLYDHLTSLADEHGLLPPWTRWWPEAETAALFPDSRTRSWVEEDEPRAALAYFQTPMHVPAGWVDRPHGYLAFGDTYAEERAQAEQWGWRTATLEGGHLHMLVEPRAVAHEIITMLRTIGSVAGP